MTIDPHEFALALAHAAPKFITLQTKEPSDEDYFEIDVQQLQEIIQQYLVMIVEYDWNT